jgi:hypothetical protein
MTYLTATPIVAGIRYNAQIEMDIFLALVVGGKLKS